MTHPLLLLSLFVAIVIGYALGRYEGRRRQHRKVDGVSREYLRGLNYLLNEQPDQAIDLFVEGLAVSEQTYETHLAMGKLFRKRGELDKATRIHSNMLNQEKLPDSIREQVQLELAIDYMSAGVLDRAEILLQELADKSVSHRDQAMEYLLRIFEREKDWNSALAIGDKLFRRNKSIATGLAHYCCELSEQMRQLQEVNTVRRTLRRALFYDPNCVRASLMLGELEMKQGHFDNAIRAYKRVQKQDAALLPEILDSLEKCYRELNQEDEMAQYLFETVMQKPSIALVLKLAEQLRRRHGEKEASMFIAEYMKAHPSIKGLNSILDMNIEQTRGEARERLDILKNLTSRLLEKQTLYQCHKCGFDSQKLHWQCPGCQSWDTIRPHAEMEVE